MNPITRYLRYRRRKKLIELESEIAGLTAKLKRTERLAAQSITTTHDKEAITITEELWKKKRMAQLLTEETPILETEP